VRLSGHHAGVTAVALSHDGAILLSGSADGALLAWTPSSGTLRGQWRGHTGVIWSLAFNSTNTLAFSASGGSDKTVRVWRCLDGICAAIYRAHSRDVLHLLQPLPHVLVSAGGDGQLFVWDASLKATSSEMSPPPLAKEQAHRGAVRAVTGHAKRLPGLLFTCGADGSVRGWRCAQRTPPTSPWQCLPVVDVRKACGVECTALALHCTADAPPLAILYASSVDGTVTCWRLHTSRGLAAITCMPLSVLELGHEPVHSLALSTDGRMLFGGRTDGTVCMWRGSSSAAVDGSGGAHTCRLGACLEAVHRGPVRVLALSPDDTFLYSAGLDGLVLQWSTSTGECVATLDGCHTGAVNAAVLSKSGAALFTGSADRTVCVFQVAAPRPRAAVPPPPAALVQVGERIDARRKQIATRLTETLDVMASGRLGRLTALLPALSLNSDRQDEPESPSRPNDPNHWHPVSGP